MLFDTHSHIFLCKKDNDDIIKTLKENNVKHIIHIWVDIESSKTCIELSKKYNDTFCSVWIHPCYTYKNKLDIHENIKKLEDLIENNRKHIKAIWECWLDNYHLNKENPNKEQEIQKQYFIEQIKLAQKYDLPVVIHTREAKEETLEIIKKTGLKKFILHCFSEDLDFAMKAIYYSNECKISFSWIVTYKKAENVIKTAANIPLEKILIETDCPYLSPQKVRWEENNPINVKYNLEQIIKLRQENWKNETNEKIEKTIFENSLKIFSIK